eukprot:gene6201-7433_t
MREYNKLKHKAREANILVPPPPSPTPRKCATCAGLGLIDASTASYTFQPAFTGHVAIIGAGIGGCALALALQQRNISVTVYEKDNHFNERSQGYGLTLQQGVSALRRLGFWGDLRELGVAPTVHVSFTPDGAILGQYGREHWGEADRANATARFNVQLPRQRLRDLLAGSLRQGTVRWGKSFASAQCVAGGDEVRIRFSDSSSARANLVVGADGIWSKVRATTLPRDDPARYLGLMVILGRGYADHPLCDTRVFQTLDGATTRMYAMPFDGQGLTMWQLSFWASLEDSLALSKEGGAAMLEEAQRRCGYWHSPWGDLLAATQPEDVTGYPVYDRPSPQPASALSKSASGQPGVACEERGAPSSEAGPLRGVKGAPSSEAGPLRGVKGAPSSEAEPLRDVKGDVKGAPSSEAGPLQDVKGAPSSEAGPLRVVKDETGLTGMRTDTTAQEVPALQAVEKSGRVVLIGDAAHPMSPFKGQGANQALLDAVELAGALAACSGGMRIALNTFDDTMCARVRAKVERSAEAAELLHSAAGLQKGDDTRSHVARKALAEDSE